jgi:hypothetical protein
MPQFFKTFGCTIPDPAISTQPECLQTLQPAPLQIRHEISISALGSVNGKNEGLNLISCLYRTSLLQNDTASVSGLQNQHFGPHTALPT